MERKDSILHNFRPLSTQIWNVLHQGLSDAVRKLAKVRFLTHFRVWKGHTPLSLSSILSRFFSSQQFWLTSSCPLFFQRFSCHLTPTEKSLSFEMNHMPQSSYNAPKQLWLCKGGVEFWDIVQFMRHLSYCKSRYKQIVDFSRRLLV